MPESAEYFDNITVGQYALTGVPLKVYVNGTYYTITAPEDVDDPLIGYGMKPNGVMEPFNYREIEHINVSGNIVDIETYKKAMDDESEAAAKAKEAEGGDEKKDEEGGDEKKDEEGGDEKKDEEGGDEKEGGSGNPFESFKRSGKLLNEKRGFTSRELRMKAIGVLESLGIRYPSEKQIKDVIQKLLTIIKSQNLGVVFEITKDEFKAEEDALKAKIEAGKAKMKDAKDKLSDLKKQPIEDGVINEWDRTTKRELTALHFETDPKKQEQMKLKLGSKFGAITSKEKMEDADYNLRKFRKEIQYGTGKSVDVFVPGGYDAMTSKLGDGPHAKKAKRINWNQKKYDEWIDSVAANGGAEHAYDMARNAKNEPGLLQWVKKNLVYDETPLERIQWDIENMAESSLMLGDIMTEIEVPTVLRKQFEKLKNKFGAFVDKLKQEKQETKEAFMTLVNAVKNNKKLSQAEKREIGDQMKDVLKLAGYGAAAVLPGGIIYMLLANVPALKKHMVPSAFLESKSLNESVIGDILIIAGENNTFEKFISALVQQKYIMRDELQDPAVEKELRDMYDAVADGEYGGMSESKRITKADWDKADETQREEWLFTAVKDPDEIDLYISKNWDDLDSEVSSNMVSLEEAKFKGSFINKRRAAAELKQKMKGKRADGMGKYTAKIFGIDSSGNPHEILSSNDLNKYSKFGLDEVTTSQTSGTKAGFIHQLDNKRYKIQKEIEVDASGGRKVKLPVGTIIYNLPGGVFAKHVKLDRMSGIASDIHPKFGMMLIKNKETLTDIERNSRVLESVNEAAPSRYDQDAIEQFVMSKEEFMDMPDQKLQHIIDMMEEEWNESAANYRDIEEYFEDLENNGGLDMFMESTNEAIDPLFPDVLKVKKDTKITSNANNERDVLPAGVYKSTGKEFDGMHIYKSKGKNWFLWPEDMDTLNENHAGSPYEYDNISEPYSIKVGDMVKNTNTSCKHFGSQGMVKQVLDMPDDIGQLIKYVVMNQGDTFKPGAILTKTADQLEPME